MIKPWTKGECIQCGQEGYITRTQEKPAGTVYICSDCEMYDNGYDDGYRDATTIERENCEELLQKIEQLEKLLSSFKMDIKNDKHK